MNIAVKYINATVVKIIALLVEFLATLVTPWSIYSQRLRSTIVYLRCFTSTAKNIEESVDIFEL
jgi:hypothetical protein